jgi:hypothetical protein
MTTQALEQCIQELAQVSYQAAIRLVHIIRMCLLHSHIVHDSQSFLQYTVSRINAINCTRSHLYLCYSLLPDGLHSLCMDPSSGQTPRIYLVAHLIYHPIASGNSASSNIRHIYCCYHHIQSSSNGRDARNPQIHCIFMELA